MVLTFKNWCQNEAIAFKGSTASNRVRDVFTGDILSLKEFIAQNFKNQDLVLLGSGDQGFAFDWIKPKPLSEEFTKTGFISADSTNDVEKVIKLTSSLKEAEIIKSYVRKFKGKPVPGLARYFWIKEIHLPKNRQWSAIFGPPKGYERERNLEASVHTQIAKIMQHAKVDKIWLICLEKLRLLNEKETKIWDFLTIYDWSLMSNKNKFNRETCYELWEWLVGPTWETNFQKGILKISEENKKYYKDNFLHYEVTKNELFRWIKRYFTLFENEKKYGFSTWDLHANNLGFRGNELVVFDCL